MLYMIALGSQSSVGSVTPFDPWVRLGITNFHNCTILSTLSINSRGFALGFPRRPLPMEIAFLFFPDSLPTILNGFMNTFVVTFCLLFRMLLLGRLKFLDNIELVNSFSHVECII